MTIFAAVHVWQVILRQPQAEMKSFPARAVAFLQAHPPSGPIFNHYDWGGYLIWKLYPSTPVFIDGRADLYGEQFLKHFADTYQLKDDWQQPFQRWNIETVLVPPDSALATGLRSAPGWIVSYEDAQAIVLTRPANAIRRAAQVATGAQEITPSEHFAGYYEWDQQNFSAAVPRVDANSQKGLGF